MRLSHSTVINFGDSLSRVVYVGAAVHGSECAGCVAQRQPVTESGDVNAARAHHTPHLCNGTAFYFCGVGVEHTSKLVVAIRNRFFPPKLDAYLALTQYLMKASVIPVINLQRWAMHMSRSSTAPSCTAYSQYYDAAHLAGAAGLHGPRRDSADCSGPSCILCRPPADGALSASVPQPDPHAAGHCRRRLAACSCRH